MSTLRGHSSEPFNSRKKEEKRPKKKKLDRGGETRKGDKVGDQFRGVTLLTTLSLILRRGGVINGARENPFDSRVEKHRQNNTPPNKKKRKQN